MSIPRATNRSPLVVRVFFVLAALVYTCVYPFIASVNNPNVRNANDGLSQLQIADGGISNISQLLDRARTLATQSSSGAFTGDRSVLSSSDARNPGRGRDGRGGTVVCGVAAVLILAARPRR